MRFMKMVGLAAVAAATMAFAGTPAASAANTALCTTHPGLICPTPASSVFALGDSILLADPVNILCLHVELEGTPLGLGNPQNVHVTKYVLSGCGTKASHDNCEDEIIQLPLGTLNKTGLDAGILTYSSGITLIVCENIDIFGTDIECEYDLTGLQLAAGSLTVTANEQPLTEIGSDFLCPNEAALDGLLTSNRHILA